MVRAVREHEDVYRLPDGMVWQFARTPLAAGRHCYTQLSAADITRQWQITEMLHCENALLEDRGNQLRREIENMETLTRQQAAHTDAGPSARCTGPADGRATEDAAWAGRSRWSGKSRRW